MSSKGQMRLGAFFNPTGHHVASWRHPRADADAGVNFQHYLQIARTAERAKLDMVFLADNVCVRDAKMEALCRSAQYIANFEPLTLLSALAPLTSHIGLVATASSRYVITRSIGGACGPAVFAQAHRGRCQEMPGIGDRQRRKQP